MSLTSVSACRRKSDVWRHAIVLVGMLMVFVTAPAALGSTGQLAVELDGLKLSIPISGPAIDMLALMDGQRTIGAIRLALASDAHPMKREDFDRIFAQLFTVLSGLNLAFLNK